MPNTAMSHAKGIIGNNFHSYSADMNVTASQRLIMETQLRESTGRDEFVLHYQPQSVAIGAGSSV